MMIQHLHVPELQWRGITDGTRCISFTKHIEDFNFLMESVLSSLNLHTRKYWRRGESAVMRTTKDAENRYAEIKTKFSNLSFPFILIRTDQQSSSYPTRKSMMEPQTEPKCPHWNSYLLKQTNKKSFLQWRGLTVYSCMANSDNVQNKATLFHNLVFLFFICELFTLSTPNAPSSSHLKEWEGKGGCVCWSW